MSRSGLVRKIDKLGRVSLPSELRRSFNLSEGDSVEFSIESNRILLEKYAKACCVCGGIHDIRPIILEGNRVVYLCRGCMIRLSSELKKGL